MRKYAKVKVSIGQINLIGNTSGRRPNGQFLPGYAPSWEHRQRLSLALKGVPKTGRNKTGAQNFHCIEYAFVAPDGVIHTGIGLKAFTEQRGLPYENMRAVLKGVQLSCAGWKKVNGRDPKNRLSPAKVNEYIDLYRQGWTCQKIAFRYGFRSANSIKQALKKAGFKEFRKGGPIRTRQYDNRLKQFMALYKQGLNVQQIAQRLHLKPKTVYCAMQRSGFTGFRTVEAARQLTLKQKYAAACTAYQMGLSTPQIAAKFSVSVATVRRALQRAGIPLRYRGINPQTKLNGEKYWRAYETGTGMSLTDIASRFNVSPAGVSRTLRLCGYQTRSASEAQLIRKKTKHGILPTQTPSLTQNAGDSPPH